MVKSLNSSLHLGENINLQIWHKSLYYLQYCTLPFFNINIYFNWRLITLQYCIGFAIHRHESAMGVHVFPILNPHPLPSPSHPSGSSQCTSPEHPVSCIELGLAIYLHNIVYMFQCYSLKSSYPHLLPQSPKVCSLHLCLFCVLHKGSSLPSF